MWIAWNHLSLSLVHVGAAAVYTEQLNLDLLNTGSLYSQMLSPQYSVSKFEQQNFLVVNQ